MNFPRNRISQDFVTKFNGMIRLLHLPSLTAEYVQSVTLESVFTNTPSTASPRFEFIKSLAFQVSCHRAAAQITKTPACVWREVNMMDD